MEVSAISPANWKKYNAHEYILVHIDSKHVVDWLGIGTTYLDEGPTFKANYY